MKVLPVLKVLIVGACALVAMHVPAVGAETKVENANEKKPVKAAIFVVNHAGVDFDNRLDTLNDLITNRLTEKGLSIIDKKEVAKPMIETREDSEQAKVIKRQLAEINLAKQKQEEDFLAGIKDDLDGASALRMAQQIGADYVLVATVTSFGVQTRKAVIFGQNVDISEYTLRIGLKLLEGVDGGSVCGDVVKSSAKVDNTIGGNNSELINGLLDDATGRIVDSVGKRVKTLSVLAMRPDAAFQINCNIESADILVDGAVSGSCGKKLNVKPGLHAVIVRREWFRDWRRTVNVQPGMVLDARLELSDLGMKKYLELKAYEREAERHQLTMEAARIAIDDQTKANEIQREADRAAISDRTKANEVQREADRAAIASNSKMNEVRRAAAMAEIADRAKLSEADAYLIKKMGDAELQWAKNSKGSLINLSVW